LKEKARLEEENGELTRENRLLKQSKEEADIRIGDAKVEHLEKKAYLDTQ